jgi:hypothetical protein
MNKLDQAHHQQCRKAAMTEPQTANMRRRPPTKLHQGKRGHLRETLQATNSQKLDHISFARTSQSTELQHCNGDGAATAATKSAAAENGMPRKEELRETLRSSFSALKKSKEIRLKNQ